MNRDEKAAAVEEIAGQLEAAETIFAIDYRGISVPQAAELREKLREADASFRIVKNRLTKLAAEKAGRENLTGLLEGPTALTFVRGDMALAAKAITTLDRDWEVLEFKGGLVNGDVLEPDEFNAIARLPGRDALNAQFAGVVASPLTGLVRGLNSMISGLASQLQQIADQGLVSGEAPPEEALAEEAAPVEEAPAEEAAPAEEPPAEEATSETEAEAAVEAEAPAEEPPAEEEAAPEAVEEPPPEAEAEPSADEEAPEEEAPVEEEAEPPAAEEAAEESAEAEAEPEETSEDNEEDKE